MSLDLDLDLDLNEKSFVENQIKYMYGDYYQIIMNNKYIVIHSIHDKDVLMEECINNTFDVKRLNIGNGCQERTQEFINFAKKFWNKDKEEKEKEKAKEKEVYVIRSDWNDAVYYTDFMLTYNRKFNYKNQIIFPLYHYHLPNSIKINDRIPFKYKKNKLFWRGSSTGSNDIKENIRYNIISKNIDKHPNIDIGFSHLCQDVYVNNKKKLDILYKNHISNDEQTQYKFILNIEGNDCASSFPWALSSNCCPLHNYPFTWETYMFGSKIEPYVHFVPINSDGSDLLEKYEWCLNNLDKCEEIANNGKKYMDLYLRDDLFNEVIKHFFKLYPLIYIPN